MNENMKTMSEEQQAANGREAYEAPKCEIIEMQNEGAILSASNESFTESDWGGSWDKN